MTRIISIHSFRRGTGKSNLLANTAALLAARGKRVGLLDTDFHTPSLQLLFDLKKGLPYSLNDYLWGKCTIEQTVQEVTLPQGAQKGGRIFLIPASIDTSDIIHVLREGYDITLLQEGFQRLIKGLALDLLLIDTHAGLSEESLLSLALADTLVIVLRPDARDYQGTSVVVDVAHQLRVPVVQMVVNEVPRAYDFAEVRQEVEKSYGCEVIAVLPHLDEMMMLASKDLLVWRYPTHPVMHQLEAMAACLEGATPSS